MEDEQASPPTPRRGADVGFRPNTGRSVDPRWMSAFGGKADVIQGVTECPLIAISGHRQVKL